MAEYCEEMLSPFFGGIIMFVKEMESLVERDEAAVKPDPSQLKQKKKKKIGEECLKRLILKFGVCAFEELIFYHQLLQNASRR